MVVLPRMWRNIVSSALMCVLLISVDDKEINYISNKLLIILYHIAWKDYNVGIKKMCSVSCEYMEMIMRVNERVLYIYM